MVFFKFFKKKRKSSKKATPPKPQRPMARTRKGALARLRTTTPRGAKPVLFKNPNKPGRPELRGFRKRGKFFLRSDFFTLKGLNDANAKFRFKGRTYVYSK